MIGVVAGRGKSLLSQDGSHRDENVRDELIRVSCFTFENPYLDISTWAGLGESIHNTCLATGTSEHMYVLLCIRIFLRLTLPCFLNAYLGTFSLVSVHPCPRKPGGTYRICPGMLLISTYLD